MLNCAIKERQPFFAMSIIVLISLSIFIASCELDGGDSLAKSHLEQGLKHMKWSQYEQAIKSYKQAIKLKPDYESAHYRLGNAYAKKGEYKEAIESYKQAIKIKPDYVYAHYHLGNAYVNSGQYEEAIEYYKRTIIIEPDYASAHIGLGFAYAFLGKDKDAVEAFEVANKLKPNILDEYIFFESFDALPQEIINSYKQFVRIYPDNKVAYSLLGAAYANVGQYKEAIESYKQAIKLKPDYESSHYGLGNAYAKKGEYKEAIESYKQAIKLKPDYESAHYSLGNAYLMSHNYSKAKSAFEVVLLINQKNEKAYYMLGVVAKNMYKNSPSCWDCGGQEINYKKAIEINPDYAEAHYSLGVIYAKSDEIEKALEEYKILKRLDTKMADKLFDIIYDDS